MILEIPVTAIPNQRFSVTLNGQSCTIELRQIGPALMISLWVDDAVAYQNSICGTKCKLGQFNNAVLSGALFFIDTLGETDPEFTGLGERYKFYYVSADDELYAQLN